LGLSIKLSKPSGVRRPRFSATCARASDRLNCPGVLPPALSSCPRDRHCRRSESSTHPSDRALQNERCGCWHSRQQSFVRSWACGKRRIRWLSFRFAMRCCSTLAACGHSACWAHASSYTFSLRGLRRIASFSLPCAYRPSQKRLFRGRKTLTSPAEGLSVSLNAPVQGGGESYT
jgi:hypothetical protein